MARFTYRETANVGAASGDCVEAARRALLEIGSKPAVAGAVVRGEVGFFWRVRLLGAFFSPDRWLPIVVTVQVFEAGPGRAIVVDVAEQFGFGSLIGMETRYRKHCALTAAWVRDRTAAILAGAPGR